MQREYNYTAFTPEEVKQGLFEDLLDYLLSYNKKAKESYYDIHITSDGYCTIVEWANVSYTENQEDGKFEFVPYNGQIMLEYGFPDNHYELCYDDADYKERLDKWLVENPGWELTSYGTWTNAVENEKFKELLKGAEDSPEGSNK